MVDTTLYRLLFFWTLGAAVIGVGGNALGVDFAWRATLVTVWSVGMVLYARFRARQAWGSAPVGVLLMCAGASLTVALGAWLTGVSTLTGALGLVLGGLMGGLTLWVIAR